MTKATRAQARIAVIGLSVVAGIFCLALTLGALALRSFGGREPQASRSPGQPPPPAPRLEVVGGADLMAVRKRAQARLSGYGWTDRGKGLARIPIDRAMHIVAARGWADKDTAP